MSSKLGADDILAGIGFVSILAGVYLWFGIPPALIIFGAVMIYIGWKIEPGKQNEPDKATSTTITEIYPGQ